jgi:hypothetical protein
LTLVLLDQHVVEAPVENLRADLGRDEGRVDAAERRAHPHQDSRHFQSRCLDGLHQEESHMHRLQGKEMFDAAADPIKLMEKRLFRASLGSYSIEHLII